MKNVYVMAGISGSGKSTWVRANFNIESEENVLFSTDEIREEFNITDYTSSEQFSILMDRYNVALKTKEVKNIIIDTTGLSVRSRRRYYRKGHNITVVLFFTPFEIARERVEERGHTEVPKGIHYQQLTALEVPIIGVDCDRVIYKGFPFFTPLKKGYTTTSLLSNEFPKGKSFNIDEDPIRTINTFLGLSSSSTLTRPGSYTPLPINRFANVLYHNYLYRMGLTGFTEEPLISQALRVIPNEVDKKTVARFLLRDESIELIHKYKTGE